MSSTGFNSQNGAGGQQYANGPLQNPVALHPSGPGYNMAQQPPYNPAQVKGPVSSAPGLYNSGPYQPVPLVSSYQAPPGQPMLHRPTMGPPQPMTPPQSANPSPGPSPRMPPAQVSPPPPVSNSYYQHPPAWQYGAPPLIGAPPPIAVPQHGPMANHVTSSPSLAPPQSSLGYNAAPPALQKAMQPLGPLPSIQGYTQPGSAPPMNPMIAPQSHQPGMRVPTAPPTGTSNATPPPPLIPRTDGHKPTPGNGYPNSFDHLETGHAMTASPQHPGQPQQPCPSSRHMGQSYPSLPPGYQNTSAQPNSSPMHHPMQTPSQPYSHAPQPYQQPSAGPAQLSPSLAGLSLQSQTPEALRVVNLLQERNLLPPGSIPPPTPCLPQDLQKVNCHPEVFRSTLTSIPQTQSLLNKAKLPLGLLLHPFKDLTQLPVVTSSTIVRCRSCRTYINPFVNFLDQRRWKCNLCYRVNDVPEEFMYNPVSRSYGEPHKRPEVQNATIEFIAPSEYMLRPPQPAVYLFVLDVSHNAVETGYVDVVCQSLLENINSLPGDSRTKIGFITFDSTIHFYNLQEGLSQPQMLIVSDIEDIFLPTPDSLLVNLDECKEMVQDLLKSLPNMFGKTMETQSALGPTLQAAFKLLSPTGGRVSVFQSQLPNLGVGSLKSREDPNQRASAKDIQHLSPATDFYKKLALDCSGQQVAVDLFLLSSQYCDLASLGCISRYSAGSVYYYPSYHKEHNPAQVECFQKDLKRYLTRKIGFEAVMRIRCTKGLSIHTFHGNFFVRSTDLLSLPNVNPDAGFAVQMSIEENLVDMQVVSFQAALLYTSSKGERRIRVHTLCLPVVNSLSDIFAGADVQAITGLLASMAVDRSVTASLSDARDAMTNASIDSLTSFRTSVLTIQQPGLLAPSCLRLFPLYILALLKQKAFRTGTSTKLDDRVFAMCQLKYQPLAYVMLMIHPALYRVDDLTDEGALNISERTIPQPRVLQLSVEKLSREGAFLMDAGLVIYLWIGRNCNPNFLTQVLGLPSYAAVPQNMNMLPELDTAESQRTRAFVGWLREQRPFFPILHVIRDESPLKASFIQNMVEDRTESALSYYEFLLHIQQQVSNVLRPAIFPQASSPFKNPAGGGKQEVEKTSSELGTEGNKRQSLRERVVRLGERRSGIEKAQTLGGGTVGFTQHNRDSIVFETFVLYLLTKATTHEIMGPKKKHLDYLIHCTNEMNVNIPQLADTLFERTANTSWVVVFKSLAATHHLMVYGNERFIQYLASRNTLFNLSNFLDKSGLQGYDMSTFIRRYSRYLNEKAVSYRQVAFDFTKVKRGSDGVMRTVNTEKLLKTIPIIQNQMDALLDFNVNANELTNGVINAAFMLLFKDAIRLFAAYNEGIINLLEKYFDMKKMQCKEGLDIYKKFLTRMTRISEFLKVAEQVGIDRGDIPDLSQAPSSLLDALEQHLASLEGKKVKDSTAASRASTLSNAVSSLANTGISFTKVDERERQAALEEEQARLKALKRLKELQKAPSNCSTTAASPVSTDEGSIITAPTIDLFSTPCTKNGTSMAANDLLDLQPAFHQQSLVLSSALPSANTWSDHYNPLIDSSTSIASGHMPTLRIEQFISGFSVPPTPLLQTARGLNVDFDSVFGNNSASANNVDSAVASLSSQGLTSSEQQPGKLVSDDLDSSLANLVGNLGIGNGVAKNDIHWSQPGEKKLTGGNNWQPKTAPSTTWNPATMAPSVMAFPATTPTGMVAYGMPPQMGSMAMMTQPTMMYSQPVMRPANPFCQAPGAQMQFM
ncbi:hypothetical protein DPEC_G00225920 [Dallia pectoralis]|uniref:Uncharacterized protein n=1 Tax=Dallia pectoralis TaxID=75939 RepID=A0ACC2G0Y0_DALPE|nr:hypothetical protein DPEC_G00225920 [Dallia pectoralis]